MSIDIAKVNAAYLELKNLIKELEASYEKLTSETQAEMIKGANYNADKFNELIEEKAKVLKALNNARIDKKKPDYKLRAYYAKLTLETEEEMLKGANINVDKFKELIKEKDKVKAEIYKTKPDSKRHPISQKVKDQVWNRDSGKCVQCDSNENLEFDHIIPHSKGGANTYRNIQLLCEPCNRKKSAKIG